MDISFSNKKIKTTTVITSIIRERNTISLGKEYNYRGRNIKKQKQGKEHQGTTTGEGISRNNNRGRNIKGTTTGEGTSRNNIRGRNIKK